ncbi:bifunctional metallophosphatase/5'-nucleotidase [Risungbinella massiliensis]|uniref:bifunctional metallophosphatase/5'-nucleotidase n=1 Tax=Risungbinella massiliensis TaxID=1329796 RepID=UPI00069ACD9A|nr:bifunctional UDP-sugar hydrolase/5'-nucleotidase [Risungbinella massiliensis]
MKKIHIVHTNDFHSRFDQMARFHTFLEEKKREWRAKNEAFLLLDVGDHMDRFHLATEGTDGLANRQVLEQTGYDAITLGNNELLTFSQAELTQNYQGANFEVISCNVREENSRELPSWLHSSRVYEVGPFRIGVTAATIPFPIVYEKMGWDVREFIPQVQKQVDLLQSESDLIVLLSHLGLPHDQQIAQEIEGLDFILGGHTHHLLETPLEVEGTLIGAAGKHGQSAGIMTIEWCDGQIGRKYGAALPLTKYKPSETIRDIKLQNIELAERNMQEPIAFLPKPLPISWDQESPFGNFLADSLREYVGAEIAMVNSGQILQSCAVGTINTKELHQICPHPINAVNYQMLGKDIRLTLEESLLPEFQQKEIKGFGFRGIYLGNMAVSGLKIEYDPHEKPYKKIASILLKGEAIQDEKWYDVATIDMFTFGLGYSRIRNGKIKEYFLPDFLRHLLAIHFAKSSNIENAFMSRWFPITS